MEVGNLTVNINGNTDELNKSINKAEDELKSFNAGVTNTVKSIGELKQEYRSLSRQSLAGKSPEEISNIRNRLAKLKDQIGDTNNTIKSLSLDPFQRLSEAVRSTSTVMSGLVGVTSLFGGEQEKMQELMQKTVALMAIANAAQEATVMFNEKAFGIFIKNKTLEIASRLKEILTINTVTASTVAENAAKTKTGVITKLITAAQWLWNAAVAANPVMILVAGVAALAAGIGFLISRMSKSNEKYAEAKREVSRLNDELERNNRLNKLTSDIISILGVSEKLQNERRVQQITEELALLDEKRKRLKLLSEQQNMFGRYTKEAKEAKEQLSKLSEEEVALMDERTLLNLKNRKLENDRAKEIEELNTKLRIALMDAEAGEYAELQRKYKKDIEDYKDSEETKKLLAKKYAQDRQGIRLKYSQAEAKDFFKPIELNQQKNMIPVKLDIPVRLTPKMLGVDYTIKEIQSSLIDITDTIEEQVTMGFQNIAYSLSDTVGLIAAGGAGMNDVFKSVLGSVGDFMQSLGRSLQAAGIGSIAFKKLLTNPALAIAAGSALVALGAMVKHKLATGPTGSGSSYSSYQSTGGSSGSVEGFRNLKEGIKVEVTGVLVGKGSDLKAVIDNEQKRLAR